MTNSTDPELLPCPFCGGEEPAHDESDTAAWVECTTLGCGACGPLVSNEAVSGRQNAAALWNARAQLQPAGVSVPDGYALVPVEPTEAMLCAGYFTDHAANRSMWKQILAAAQTVKAEQVQCDTCHGQGEICVGQQTFGYMSMQPPEPIMEVCPECGGEEAPSLPASGSAVEEVEVVGYLSGLCLSLAEYIEDEGGIPDSEKLMTVAQHQRIVAALSAQQSAPELVSVPVELLELLRNFTVQHDSGVAGVLRGNIDALLASHGRGEA